MKDGRCGRRYPRAYRDDTVDHNDGYPEYRRRDTQKSYVIGGPSASMLVDNRWVVPYNRGLMLKYNAHMNVEVCGTIYAVKYLHKYIHKGGDRAEVEYAAVDEETVPRPAEVDEIKMYQEGRYISSSEAVWRIFKFPLHSVLVSSCYHVSHSALLNWFR